ncbi:Uncharacterised protein [Fusobacterium necrogenes]|uniref:ESAT-6 secretion machinery protein EssA n=1 Tax=Fusobacterium necrogenes TaxID=858 RepID=A0A377GW98_9FUSO|nr:hypothetical protein [Fusobacterium necrogenes]STO31238.1 Uncharacterised protein [Fusobacterium necrogenes]
MKKLFTMLFLLSAICVLGAGEDVTALDKEIQGINKEQLEIREIPTEEVILKEQNINSGAIEVTNDNYQNQTQKIKVVQEKSALEDELSQGVEEKSIWKYILGGIGVIALIIAL